MRDWAHRVGVDFSLTVDDLRPWLVKDYKIVPGVYLERRDKTRGFDPDNLKVKNMKALQRRADETDPS